MSALASTNPLNEDVLIETIDKATSLQISDQGTYDFAVRTLDGIKSLRDAAEAHHRPIISSAFQTHRLACAALAKIDSPLEAAEKKVKLAIWTWDQEQKRIEDDRKRAAREEAERKQREDTQRQLDEARRAAEAKQLEIAKQAEEQISLLEASGGQVVEIAEISKKAEEKIAEVAQETVAEVQTIVHQAETAPVARPVVAPTYERSRSVSSGTIYKAQVKDLKALCRAVADGKVSEENVMGLVRDKDDDTISSPTLNKAANAMRGVLSIPGVGCLEAPKVSSRRR